MPGALLSRFADTPKKALFLHGMSSTGSRKTWFLRSLGFDVLTPRMSDWSLRSAVRTARAACDEFEPDVIVGSSRGGAVAMALVPSGVPLVLLAPAWRWCGVPPRVSAPQAVVIHSPSDRWVRLDDSVELCRQNPHVRLIAAGDGHRLNDPAARAVLADVLNDLFPTEEKHADC